MAKLHVHIIYEHGSDLKPFGVAYIRDILPLTHPVNAEALQVTQGTGYSRADVIILERAWKPKLTLHQVEQLVRQVRQDGAYLVYSIDDNLLDLEYPPDEELAPGDDYLSPRQAVRFFCRSADGVLVSTEHLKERLARLNPRIVVLPNALDERLFYENGKPLPPDRNTSSCRVIGFMGTFTHDADVMMVLQALRGVLRRHSDSLRFQIVGGVSNPSFLRLFQGLPVQTTHPSPEFAAYPNFTSWMKANMPWDIGISPLDHTLFNRSKSDIKFLDYSALGIPGIYSRVPTYEGTIRHLETGWLAENTPAAWTEALDSLLADADLRHRLAKNAQEYVFARRTLQYNAHLWREAIFSIMQNR